MKERAHFPNRPIRPLVARAQLALGMTHRNFGEALGSSERTSLRWARGTSSMSVPQLCTLARLVHARDPELAASIAEASSETLESLGIVAPPPPVPPPAPPPPPPLPPRFVADLIVCVAADAVGVPPSIARTAVLAALTRAREMGLTVAEAESALTAAAPIARAEG